MSPDETTEETTEYDITITQVIETDVLTLVLGGLLVGAVGYLLGGWRR